MKKLFLLGLMFALMSGVCNVQKTFAEDTEADTQIIKDAIEKYKDKNYLGCISDLRLYTEKDATNAVAWYYLGNAYMNISMKPEAHAAFAKVVNLNTVPKLTSYSIQAQICMENSAKCNYQEFTNDQIKKLISNPNEFLEQYFANLNNNTKDADTIEIENLIKGGYPNNIHPSARDFIQQERIKMKQVEINENKASVPADYNLADAAELFKMQNSMIASFAMMMDTPVQNNGTDYAELIKKYQNIKENNDTISPETVQLMMMQNMLPSF